MAQFRFASLGSGSKGNATLVNWGENYLLIDCGFSIKELKLRLARFNLVIEQLSAVLVTHEHTDHIKGIATLAKRYGRTVYMTPGTSHSKGLESLLELRLIQDYQPFVLNDLYITPVPVPHDAREPIQYLFEFNSRKLGVLTDLGSITPFIEDSYRTVDAMILEANHDSQMLASGVYPASLKRRVGGSWGHLNNQQAAGFLARIDSERLQHLVLAHISQQNNSVDLVRSVVAPVTGAVQNVTYACQDHGFDWLSVV